MQLLANQMLQVSKGVAVSQLFAKEYVFSSALELQGWTCLSKDTSAH